MNIKVCKERDVVYDAVSNKCYIYVAEINKIIVANVERVLDVDKNIKYNDKITKEEIDMYIKQLKEGDILV